MVGRLVVAAHVSSSSTLSAGLRSSHWQRRRVGRRWSPWCGPRAASSTSCCSAPSRSWRSLRSWWSAPGIGWLLRGAQRCRSAGVRWTRRQRMRSGSQHHRRTRRASMPSRPAGVSAPNWAARTKSPQPQRNTAASKYSWSNPSPWGTPDDRTTWWVSWFISRSTPRRSSPDSHHPRRDHGELTTAGMRSCCSARPTSLVLGGPLVAVCP